jgi:hypothetical protein
MVAVGGACGARVLVQLGTREKLGCVGQAANWRAGGGGRGG